MFGSLRLTNEWSWRLPTLLQIFAAALQLSLMALVPDSPRWLVSHGRPKESLAILARYHANNDSADELVAFEHHQICDTIEADVRAQSEGSLAMKGPWHTFTGSPANRRVLLLIILVGIYSQWSGNGIISIYFSYALRGVGVVDPSRQVRCSFPEGEIHLSPTPQY